MRKHAEPKKTDPADAWSCESKPGASDSLSDNFMFNVNTLDNENDIYQYSILSAPHGTSIPTLDIHSLSTCGDHGIGVLSGNYGELLYIKNQPTQIQVDEGGYVTINSGARITEVPLTFFMGVRFRPQIVAMKEVKGVQDLEALFRGNNGNLEEAFTSFKITGEFDNVIFRITGAATHPAPFSLTLADMAKRASKKTQGHISNEKTQGTIFGFCAPAWANDLCFNGIMCWFRGTPKIVKKHSKSAGLPRPPWVGHVADFKSKGALKVEWAVARKWNLQTNDGKRYSAVRPGTEEQPGRLGVKEKGEAEVVVIDSSDEEESESEDTDDDTGNDSDGGSDLDCGDHVAEGDEESGSDIGSGSSGSNEEADNEDNMDSEDHGKA
jgi:alpha-acetolactate decarboxylase